MEVYSNALEIIRDFGKPVIFMLKSEEVLDLGRLLHYLVAEEDGVSAALE